MSEPSNPFRCKPLALKAQSARYKTWDITGSYILQILRNNSKHGILHEPRLYLIRWTHSIGLSTQGTSQSPVLALPCCIIAAIPMTRMRQLRMKL